MTKPGFAMPAKSIHEVEAAAETIINYPFDSFSVYGDLGELPPYAALHTLASTLNNSTINNIGPMCFPIGLAHAEIISGHAAALNMQLPERTSLGITRGAFLEQINEAPASLAELKSKLEYVQLYMTERELNIPLYIGGFGPKLLQMAGQIGVTGVKLGGSVNPGMAKYAREQIRNQDVDIVLGAVSVLDHDRSAARMLARLEVAKYLAIVGEFDTTLNEDESDSLQQFKMRYFEKDPNAHEIISDSLLDKFAIAGTPDDFLQFLGSLEGYVDRFEFGTPHGLHSRVEAINLLGTTVIKEMEIK